MPKRQTTAQSHSKLSVLLLLCTFWYFSLYLCNVSLLPAINQNDLCTIQKLLSCLKVLPNTCTHIQWKFPHLHTSCGRSQEGISIVNLLVRIYNLPFRDNFITPVVRPISAGKALVIRSVFFSCTGNCLYKGPSVWDIWRRPSLPVINTC